MKKPLLFSLLLLSAFPLSAMESKFDRAQRLFQETALKTGLAAFFFGANKIDEIPSLVDCCKQFMRRERKADDIRSAKTDEKDMEKVLSLDLPLNIACQVLENIHQSIWNLYEERIAQLLASDCNKDIKNIIINRLTKVDHYALLIHDSRVAMDIKYRILKHFPACQAKEHIAQLAEEGALDEAVIELFVKLSTAPDFHKCLKKEWILTQRSRGFGNDKKLLHALNIFNQNNNPMPFFDQLHMFHTKNDLLLIALIELLTKELQDASGKTNQSLNN